MKPIATQPRGCLGGAAHAAGPKAITRPVHNQLWLIMKLFAFLASLFGASSPAAESKMVDPKSILFSTPTLNDALPAFQKGGSSGGRFFEVHEDDWRQFEAVSTTYRDQIEHEFAAIRDVLATSSVKTKVGDRELTAFRKVHVRKTITEPINGGLLLSRIASVGTNPTEYTGLSLSGSPSVLGGYALAMDGVVVFGQADGDRVLSLCFSSRSSPSVDPERARKLLDILRASGLTVVHWPSATELSGTALVAYLTGSPQEQHTNLGVQARQAFEQELGKRGLHFTIDEASGRYRLSIEGTDLLVSIDNLQRDLAADGDLSRVSRFVDTVVTTKVTETTPVDPARLFWCIEPNDHVEKADYRKAVSDRVDRVLVLVSADNTRITWVTPAMLAKASVAPEMAEKMAFENLSREMERTKIEFSEIEGVRLGYLNTLLPIKASLLLAPNLKARVENMLGWPIMAVAPDRDFLYLWAAKHKDFVNRVGHTTVEQYSKASYPLSTEVYSVSESGIKALGEFPSSKEK